MLSLLPVLLTCAITEPTTPATAPAAPAAVAYTLLESPGRRVRAPDPRMRGLLAEGFHRSATFASLLTALNDSNVIVYVEALMTMPKETRGRITIVPRAGRIDRYLRIQIRHDLSKREAIALIGHEMRHALEIADATDVRDIDGLIKLYERIGHSTGGEHTYDTIAAQDTGRKILGELVGS